MFSGENGQYQTSLESIWTPQDRKRTLITCWPNRENRVVGPIKLDVGRTAFSSSSGFDSVIMYEHPSSENPSVRIQHH